MAVVASITNFVRGRLKVALGSADAGKQVADKIDALIAGTVTQTLTNKTITNPTVTTGTFTSPTLVTPAIGVATGTSLAATGAVTSSGTAGIGYATGAGGAVTQATSRTTGVTINKTCGTITLVSAAGSATPFSFTVTNSTVAATDVVLISQKSGTDKYTTQMVTNVAAGSFQVTLANASGTTTEQPAFNFVVIKSVAA